MEETNKTDRYIAHRVLIAAAVVFIIAPVVLYLLDHVIGGGISSNPRVLIGVAGVMAVITDRLYVKLYPRNKERDRNT